ncbi:tripartite motif-containing protein 42-like [Mytilus californianus]|uniref:tripartite motif-containing protein 42-like n=1 Tax=Mytilus californianus TaxID=6549 RepID=UPI002245ECE3|nr:tripartite motif-containing protein 42-like [Mytilus californianus]
MAHGNYSEIESKCGICLSPYTEPRLLDCFHSFCTPCLEKLDVHDNYLTCPLCRTHISIPDKGVSGLKSYSFKFEQPHRANNSTDICEFCSEENTAVAKCLDCKINLCLNCRDYHRKIKTSQNHSLENLKVDQLDKHNVKSIKECEEHRKELTLLCKPCNILLCSECSEKSHCMHDFQNLTLLIQTRKKLLLTRTASLKSRISVLKNTEELVQQEENMYHKHCNIAKKDIIAHATSVKDVFCNTVDILTNKSLARIDIIKKKDVKVINTYLNEIETEQLSLAGLIKTTEGFINSSSDEQFTDGLLTIACHLDKVLNKTGRSFSLNYLKYESGEFNTSTIEQLFGQLNVCAIGNVITPLYQKLPMPAIFPEANKEHTFTLSNKIIDIVAANKYNTWIFTENLVSLYNRNGVVSSTFTPPVESKRMLKKSADELWFWTGQSAAKKVNTQFRDGYKVPFEGGLVGCFIQSGNLLVYNMDEEVFYEVTEQEGVRNKIKIEDPTKKLRNIHVFTGETILMAETSNSNLVFSSRNNIVVIADKHGTILETFERKGAKFRGLTVDNYGQIFVADYEKDFIDILSEGGVFQRNLLNNKNGDKIIYKTNHITLDECGFLWVFDHFKKMTIFSCQ